MFVSSEYSQYLIKICKNFNIFAHSNETEKCVVVKNNVYICQGCVQSNYLFIKVTEIGFYYNYYEFRWIFYFGVAKLTK